MSFVDANAYDRFMGRFSTRLAPVFADFAGVRGRVLDVGCGPGALTAELVRRLGAEDVAAVDPSEPFVVAARERQPGVDVRRAAAEELPFADGEFDTALAQLVVHFMADPAQGAAELARVTRPGGTVAACVWDYSDGRGALGPFWEAAADIDPDVSPERGRMGSSQGELDALLRNAGLDDVEETVLEISLALETFEEWWEPFTFGIGPAGAFVTGLDDAGREQLRERCRELLPEAPFALGARCWAARGCA